MTLLDANDFPHAANLSKVKRPIDRDSDGRVYDGTKRERPALPSEMLPSVGRKKGRGLKGAGGGKRRGAGRQDEQRKYVVAWVDDDGPQAQLFEDRARARSYGLALKNGGQAKNIRAVPEDHPDFDKLIQAAGGRDRVPSRLITDPGDDDDRDLNTADFKEKFPGQRQDFPGQRRPGEDPRDRSDFRRRLDEAKKLGIEAAEEGNHVPPEEYRKDPNMLIAWNDGQRIGSGNRKMRERPEGPGRAMRSQLGPAAFDEPDSGIIERGEEPDIPRGRPDVPDLRQGGRREAGIDNADKNEARLLGIDAFHRNEGRNDYPEGYDEERRDAWQRGWDNEKRRLRERRAARVAQEADQAAAADAPENKPHFVVHARNNIKRYDNKADAEKAAKGGLIIGPDHEQYDVFMDAKKPNQVQMEGINERRRVAREGRGGAVGRRVKPDGDVLRNALAAGDERSPQPQNWDESNQYQVGDVVLHNGNRWRALRNLGDGQEPGAAGWMLLDSKPNKQPARKPRRRQRNPLANEPPGGFRPEDRVGGEADRREVMAVELKAKGDARAGKPKQHDLKHPDLARAYENAYDQEKAKANPIKPEPALKGPALRDKERQDREAALRQRAREAANAQAAAGGDIRPQDAKDLNWWRRQGRLRGARPGVVGRSERPNGLQGKEGPNADKALAAWREGIKQKKPDADFGEVKEERKPKFQVRRLKDAQGRPAGYKVVGRDEKGKRREFGPIKDQEVARKIKAMLHNGQEPTNDDFLNSFDLAAKRRRLKENAAREARAAAGGADNDPIKRQREAVRQLQDKLNGPDGPKGDPNKPHVAMWFDEWGKHVKVFDDLSGAANHVLEQHRKNPNVDNNVIGPDNPTFKFNAAMDPKHKAGRVAMAEMLRDAGQGTAADALIANDSSAIESAQRASDAMLNVARQPSPGETAGSDSLKRKAEEQAKRAGEAFDRVDGLGGHKQNRVGRAWIRALQHGAMGNRDAWVGAVRDMIRIEQQDGDFSESERDALLVRVEDDILGDDFDEMMEQAFRNVGEWGDDARPGFIRQLMNNQAQAVKPDNTGDKNNMSAIKKHFDGGGDISSAPIGDVVAAVKANPKRFTMYRNGKKGISPNWWVVDTEKDTGHEVKIPVYEDDSIKWVKTSNEVWVFKASASGDYGNQLTDDVLNEVMGQNIQEQMGMNFSPARWGTPDDADQPYVLQKHLAHVDSAVSGNKPLGFLPAAAFTSRSGKGEKVDGWKKGSGWLDNLEDPTQLVELGLFDYLIQNRDRHDGNWSGMVMEDGKIRIGVFDNGFGFRVAERLGQTEKNPVSYWSNIDRQRGGHLRNGLSAFRTRQEARDALNNVIDRIQQIDAERFLARLDQGGISAANRKIAADQIQKLIERAKMLDQKRDEILREFLGG